MLSTQSMHDNEKARYICKYSVINLKFIKN
jgi:hypothetical protein